MLKVIRKGSSDLKNQDQLSCCWPPGTENMQTPTEMDDREIEAYQKNKDQNKS